MSSTIGHAAAAQGYYLHGENAKHRQQEAEPDDAIKGGSPGPAHNRLQSAAAGQTSEV